MDATAGKGKRDASRASANFPPPGEANGCSSGSRRSTFVRETIGEDDPDEKWLIT